MICSISFSGKVCKTSLLCNFFITSSRDVNVEPSSFWKIEPQEKKKKIRFALGMYSKYLVPKKVNLLYHQCCLSTVQTSAALVATATLSITNLAWPGLLEGLSSDSISPMQLSRRGGEQANLLQPFGSVLQAL